MRASRSLAEFLEAGLAREGIHNPDFAILEALLHKGPLAISALENEKMLTWTIAGLAAWLGWVVTLLVAERWLERDGSAPRPAAATAPGVAITDPAVP